MSDPVSNADIIKQTKVDFNQTFGTDAGRRVLELLRKWCFKRDTTYTGSRDSVLINEGRRQILMSIENIIELDVDELIKKGEKV